MRLHDLADDSADDSTDDGADDLADASALVAPTASHLTDALAEMEDAYDAWHEEETRRAHTAHIEDILAWLPPTATAERAYQNLRLRYSPAYFAGSAQWAGETLGSYPERSTQAPWKPCTPPHVAPWIRAPPAFSVWKTSRPSWGVVVALWMWLYGGGVGAQQTQKSVNGEAFDDASELELVCASNEDITDDLALVGEDDEEEEDGEEGAPKFTLTVSNPPPSRSSSFSSRPIGADAFGEGGLNKEDGLLVGEAVLLSGEVGGRDGVGEADTC